MHNTKDEIYSIPINYVSIVFFWSIATLLVSIPFDAEITAIILFFNLSKINFAKTFKLKSSNTIIPLYGCTLGLIIHYISKIASYDRYNLFNEAPFIEYLFGPINDPGYFLMNLNMVLSVGFMLVPVIGGTLIAKFAYEQSDIKNLKGPLIDSFTNFSPEKINVESPIDVLNCLCVYGAYSMVSILITGLFVGFILHFSIALAVISFIYLLTHKDIDEISILWDKPEKEVEENIILTSNYKINIMKIYSWMAFLPLVVIILIGIVNNNYILLISIPTICYFLLYNFRLNKRLKYNTKIFLPLGSLYLTIACMLSLNILIFREILIIDTMLNLSLNSFQNFLVADGISIMILNSTLATILLSMEYSKKFKNFNGFDKLKNEYKIIIFAILGVLVVPFVGAFHSPVPSNFLFLILVMFCALMIFTSFVLPYYYIEIKQFIKDNTNYVNIIKMFMVFISILGSIIIINIYSYFAPTAEPEIKPILYLLLLCVPMLIAINISMLLHKNEKKR